MIYDLKVTENANRDLDDILGYIVNVLKNKEAAIDMHKAVIDCFDRVVTMPHMYPVCSNDRLSERGYRKAIVKNYLFIYHVNEEEKRVEVLRFFFQARKYESLV